MWVVLAAIVDDVRSSFECVYIMSSEEQRRPIAMPRMFLVSTVPDSGQ